MNAGEEKGVFVTVGTTCFEELIQAATEEDFLKLLVSLGYSRLTLQIGRGVYEPTPSVDGISVEVYRFKKNLRQDMSAASLIISHGGAGSVMESLALQKPLIVIINELLMDNHQTELARQLQKDGHLLHTTHSKLYSTVKEMAPEALMKTPYKTGQPELFGQYLNSVMGFPRKRD